MGAAVGPGRSSPLIHRDGCDRFTPTNAASRAPPRMPAKYLTRETDSGSSAPTRVADVRAAVVVFLAAVTASFYPTNLLGDDLAETDTKPNGTLGFESADLDARRWLQPPKRPTVRASATDRPTIRLVDSGTGVVGARVNDSRNA